jgi:hypothetical protein
MLAARRASVLVVRLLFGFFVAFQLSVVPFDLRTITLVGDSALLQRRPCGVAFRFPEVGGLLVAIGCVVVAFRRPIVAL